MKPAATSRSELARWLLRGMIAFLAAGQGACATLQQLRFEEPAVELNALEVTGIDLEGVSLNLVLDVFNPNDYDIGTTRVDADLEVEDTHFGSALLQESVTLVAAQHTLVRIPARFTWEGVGAGARALLQRGAVAYQLETRLRVGTSLGSRTVSLRSHGEAPIADLIP